MCSCRLTQMKGQRLNCKQWPLDKKVLFSVPRRIQCNSNTKTILCNVFCFVVGVTVVCTPNHLRVSKNTSGTNPKSSESWLKHIRYKSQIIWELAKTHHVQILIQTKTKAKEEEQCSDDSHSKQSQRSSFFLLSCDLENGHWSQFPQWMCKAK